MHAYLIVGKDEKERRAAADQKSEAFDTREVLVFSTEAKHTIKEVRGLKSTLAFAPRDPEKGRVVIIEEANLFTQEAANAFLKTLEEPAGNTLFVLTAPNEEQVIETVRSRCQLIDLGAGGSEPNGEEQAVLDKLLKASPAERQEFLETIKDRQGALDFCRGQLLAARGKLRISPSAQLLSLVERLDQIRLDLEANVNVKLALGDLLLNFPRGK